MKVVIAWLALSACGAPSPPPRSEATPPAAQSTPSAAIAVPITGCAWSFAGEFRIGGQPFRLQIDTGSAPLAIAGAGCSVCSAEGVQNAYSPGPTATDQHHVKNMMYGGGGMSWTGDQYEDVVAIGDAHDPVELYAITSERHFFASGPCSVPEGILGLAGSGPGSLVSQLATKGMPETFALNECAGSGTLWLGGFDAAAAKRPPIYTPMTETPMYEVAVSGFAVGGTHIPLAEPLSAIVDSGGPMIIVPQATYSSLTAAIAANPTFASVFGDASWFGGREACATPKLSKAELDAALPPLTVHLGGIDVTMAATDSYLEILRDDHGTRFCAALATQPNIHKMDLGNSVIRSHLVIFDREHARMGFAPVPPCI
jgi:hypothetical protein